VVGEPGFPARMVVATYRVECGDEGRGAECVVNRLHIAKPR